MNDFDEELFQGDDLISYLKGVIKPTLWFRFKEVAGLTAVNSGSLALPIVQRLVDGDFEKVGVADFIVVNNAILTKQTASPHDGTRYLKVAYNGTNFPGAQQNNVFVAGHWYRSYGWCRKVSGTGSAFLQSGAITWGSTANLTWTYFDFTFQATNDYLVMAGTNDTTCEFDSVVVTEMAYDGLWTLGAGALGQPGQMGSADAALFDAANTKLTVPAGPFGNYQLFTIGILVNFFTTGEGTIGTVYDWATSTALRFNFGTNFRSIRAAPTPAESNTSSGIIAGTWYWFFVTLSVDKKLRIYKHKVGSNSEFGYSLQNAAVGAYTDQSAVPLIIGNRADQSATLNGLIDEWFMVDRDISVAEMVRISDLTMQADQPIESLEADYGVYQDAALTIPAVADGDPVGGWKDQAGNVGRPPTAAGLNRPTLKLGANGIGGRPAILFNGIQYLTSIAFIATIAQPTTIYVVFQFADVAAQYAVVDGIAAGNRHLVYNNAVDFGKWQIYAGTTVTEVNPTINTNPHVLAAIFNGASSQLWVDGVQHISGNANTNTLTGLTVGAAFTLAVNLFKGKIAAVRIYNTVHSATRRAMIEEYYRSKYGI